MTLLHWIGLGLAIGALYAAGRMAWRRWRGR